MSEDANEDAYSIDSISWTGEDVCDVVESDSEPEVVCFANLGDSDGDDGLSDCESIEKDDVLNSKNDDQNSVMRMAKDLREMMFHMPADDEIKLQVGQVFNCMADFNSALKDYAIQNSLALDRKKMISPDGQLYVPTRAVNGGSMHLFWWIKYQLRLELLKGAITNVSQFLRI